MKQLPGQGSKLIRVVFDTNVLISSFVFEGRLKPIADSIERDQVIPYFITSTFLEFQRVIYYRKFQRALTKLAVLPEDIVNAVVEKSVILPDPLLIPVVISHPPDNFILACALEARVSFIVSGDSHLTNLKSFHSIPILMPAQFLKKMKKKKL